MHSNGGTGRLDRLYDYITGDEDARVCKEIPEAACRHQPRNYFAYLTANLLNKVADELTSAKLVLPWLLGALGAPVGLTGFLVPIRESGVLLPQLMVAALVRKLARRKGVWLLGALLSALALGGMAVVAFSAEGALAGGLIIALLVLFSLARGLCSVSAKDVLGKTVSKSRRGNLMGWSAGLGGLAVVVIGLAMSMGDLARADVSLFGWLFLACAGLWIAALLAFAIIHEEPGATEGGGNALGVAIDCLGLLRTDDRFRHFITARLLLLSVALATPYYVLLAQTHTGNGLDGLGWLIVATGIGASVSSPFWGHLGDRSSRSVMALAAGGQGLLGVAVFICLIGQLPLIDDNLFWAAVMIVMTILHAGVRLGRKIYLVDMATGDNRAAYVALSNTLIGVAMLGAGFIGLIGDWLGLHWLILLLALASLVAAVYARQLDEVSG
ncbi:MAG: MFS transporter [Candidatus Thiodiazotropha sp.]